MSEREGVEAMPPRLVSTMEENVYPTDEDEQFAETATFANQARHAIEKHESAGELDEAIDRNDAWALAVYDVLCEAQEKLRELTRQEVRLRPGMLEIAHAYRDAFWAERAEATPSPDQSADPVGDAAQS